MEEVDIQEIDVVCWKFIYNDEISFAENLKKLLQYLDIKNLDFISTKKDEANRYIVNTVTWTGTVSYIKDCLKQTVIELNNKLVVYAKSDESLHTLIADLKTARIFIKEYLTNHNIYDDVLFDSKPFVGVYYNCSVIVHEIPFIECILTENAKKEIIDPNYYRNINDNIGGTFKRELIAIEQLKNQYNYSFNAATNTYYKN